MTNQNKILDSKELCPSCFSKVGIVAICPVCGYQRGSLEENYWNKLALGTIIHDRYLIGRTLGQGGFGITYLGFDLKLKIKLAIKEYYPSGIAVRNPTNRTVTNATRDVAADFKQGMSKFLEEARTLAQFEDYPNIVSVRDFFESNGTAYMVMNYLEGRTMLKYLNDKGGVISFNETITILAPIMDALNEVHASGLIHRDISPDNVFVTDSGQVKLLDFGAAKYAMAMVNQQSHSIVLKKGYSPAEQYQSRGSLGPWTDIYSMAATIYRSIVGSVPPDSIDRMGEDVLVPPSQQGIQIPDYAEVALLRALSISPNLRQQNMKDFKQALLGENQSSFVADSEQEVVAKSDSSETVLLKPSDETGVKEVSSTVDKASMNEKKKSPIAIIIAAIVVILAIGGFMLTDGQESAEVMFNKGNMYLEGKGVEQNYAEAFKWYKKAADLGNADAMNSIGWMCRSGQGVEQNSVEAMKWYKKAVDLGDDSLMIHIGCMYLIGEGVKKNYAEGFKWYKKAADLGDADAMNIIGRMYLKGKGVKQNYAEALRWYKKAVDLGDVDAMYHIGWMYENGRGLVKNKIDAIAWYKKAAEKGNQDAIKRLRELR